MTYSQTAIELLRIYQAIATTESGDLLAKDVDEMYSEGERSRSVCIMITSKLLDGLRYDNWRA